MYVIVSFQENQKMLNKFCMSGAILCWVLLLSSVSECIAGFSLFRIQERTMSHFGNPHVFSRIVVLSWGALLTGTYGAGFGLLICSGLFVFDDPHDRVEPERLIGICYLGAAVSQFIAGAAMLRANEQVKACFASSAGVRTISAVEMPRHTQHSLQ